MAALVRTEVNDGVATVVLDNPPVNALREEVLTLLGDAVRRAPHHGARAIVLAATGDKAFAAGADVAELEAILASRQRAEAHVALTAATYGAITSSPLPVVASVEAPAVGGGCELVLACDLVVIEEQAQLRLPEVTLGLIPGAGGTQRLTRAVGLTRAKAMLMLGRPIAAEQALAWGLVTEVVPGGQARARAAETARQLAAQPPESIVRLKQLVNGAGDGLLDDGLAAEREAFLSVLRTPDAHEGCRAFIEKRAAAFSGAARA